MKKGLALLFLSIALMGCAELSQILGPEREPDPVDEVIPTTLTVTFDSLGGSSVTPATNVPPGGLIEPPPPPTKPDAAFAGWFTDPGLTQRWRFDSDMVRTTLTLYARWGSDDAVGTWFDLTDNGLIDGTSDDVETIWVFETSGRYLQFSRTHQAGGDWTSTKGGPVVDGDTFLLLEEGGYYLDSGTLHRTPRRINVIAKGLVSGSLTDTAGFGPKNEAEALVTLDGTAWETSVPKWFHPDSAALTFQTVALAKWDDHVPLMLWGTEVLAQSPLATVKTDSGEDFRAPNALADYPPEVQALFPADPIDPLGPSDAEVEAAWAAYEASAFFQGLAAAGTALADAAAAEFESGKTSIDQNGTSGSVAWTNKESLSNIGKGTYDYSGTATYKPTGDETLTGGIILLKTTVGTSSYAGNEGGQTSNTGTWTLQFSGGKVKTLVYEWDDLTKSYVGPWKINDTFTYDPTPKK